MWSKRKKAWGTPKALIRGLLSQDFKQQDASGSAIVVSRVTKMDISAM